jgi:hypothetical protein
MTNYNINTIEAITFAQAAEIAIEEMTIKEHDCFFVDFGGTFGYSVLVFKNAMHIHYANDYELHHSLTVEEKGREVLREHYIESLNNKLFTDAELMESISSYDEYKRKDYFLRNYWIMRHESLSVFGCGEEAKRKFNKLKSLFPYYNNICFCYVQNRSIVETCQKYSDNLESEYKKLSDNETEFRRMISYELANHEACITCDYTDTLRDLGLTFDSLEDWKKEIVKEELNKQIADYC